MTTQYNKNTVTPKTTVPAKTTTTAKTTTIPVVKQKTEEQLNLERIVAAQVTERLFAPVTHESMTKPVAYVTAANGLFKVTKTPIGLFKEQLETFKTEVIGLPPMEAGVDLAIPKIPMRKIVQALSYYRDINTKDRTEASVLFFWNHNDVVLPDLPGLSAEGKLVTYCPIQKNSGGLSNFTMDTHVAWMRSNLALLLETHSHNTMDAFFSGTDDANENMTQFYGVWGRVADEQPKWAFRYVVGKSKIQCDPSILIDWPRATVKETIISTKEVLFEGDTSVLDMEMPEEGLRQVSAPTEKEVEQSLIKGPFKAVAYPADWMTQHTANTFTSRYAPKNGVYGGSYGGHGGRYKSDVSAYGGTQGSLEDFYDEEFEWASRAAGYSAKKWDAEEERKNANEPRLLPLAEIEQSISDEIFIAAEKGLPSAELIRACENFAIELVQDGDDINLFV